MMLLDFGGPFNVARFDELVVTFYTCSGKDRTFAHQSLITFQDHPDAWTRVPEIVQQSSRTQAKFLGLRVLEQLVTTRWKSLSDSQRQGIRNFIVGVIVQGSLGGAKLRKEKRSYGNKLNLVLVHILKQEWPHNWPTFTKELVESSRTSKSLCENNMAILKLLSEEIFDFPGDQMTQARIKALENQMRGDFTEIFRLCCEMLEEEVKESVIKTTMEALLKFLNWIPLEFIFETQIIDILLVRFLETRQFRNVTLKCLAEIAALKTGSDYDQKFVAFFKMSMTSINRMIPLGSNIAKAYMNTSFAGREFLLNLALFLVNFLTSHVKIIEGEVHRDVLLNAHFYMIQISQVKEKDIFKICLEYWIKLVSELYDEMQAACDHDPMTVSGLGETSEGSNAVANRRQIYADVLSNLRLVAIERMVKPEEVLITENEEGEIVREVMKEIDSIALYKQMRELLVYLTHLDVIDTEAILSEKLAKQADGSEWSWRKLNSLCWSIGSISGSMEEETEKRFLVAVIKTLLSLVEKMRGSDAKAVLSSNIMYIVGQYPRFLKTQWKFLKIVVKKIFEFMHETHDGVQDMACDTFVKISQKCKRHFVMQRRDERETFVDEILRLLYHYTLDLSAQQVHIFYEAVGYMISAHPNKHHQEKLIGKLMELPNSSWDALMARAASGIDVLGDPEHVASLSNIIKTNVALCSSVGNSYLSQIGRIFLDMLGLYKAASGVINETVRRKWSVSTRIVKVRQLRAVKKDVLRLLETYINKTEQLEAVSANFLPPLLDAVLGDYNANVPVARDADVLNLMATITSRLGSLLKHQVHAILDTVFKSTLHMINRDFIEYPEHRSGFYRLLREINMHCFQALLEISPQNFKLFMDSIMWGIKHSMRDIAEIALNLCLELLNNFDNVDSAISDIFFQHYFLSIIQDIYFVLTDTEHKSGFRLQSQILAHMYQLVETDSIRSPLFSADADPNITNAKFMREYTTSLLKKAFPYVHDSRIQTFVANLVAFHRDIGRFKLALRDFLIQLKEFAGDNADLFLEEQEAKAHRKAQQEHDVAMHIPGMLKSVEKDEDI